MEVKVSELKQRGAEYCKRHKHDENCSGCPLSDKFMCIDSDTHFVLVSDEVEADIFANDFRFMLREIFKED